MKSGQLYFIGLLPPPEIREEITRLKEYFRENFGITHALKSPPHITLAPPFNHDESNEKFLISQLDQFSGNEPGFPVVLENFGAFVPRVIYVDVVKNASLENLYLRTTDMLSAQLGFPPDKNAGRPYNPHVTVAFKDLLKQQFREAWPEFSDKKIRYEFHAGGITLLKHSGKQWEILHTAAFKK
ncbi:MAG TPA: 2'-5' RNA ligase family protein [Cyclobacteriaceae bacterium]|nr:2'-5' RNA ligase family protein [Cyclobacteriaceae bacterium]